MLLEVGKKYVCKDRADVKYIRIDAIRPDVSDIFERVACSIFYNNGMCRDHTSTLDGRCCFNEAYKLIAEYEEPKLSITEKDVGRKVRSKKGAILQIIGFYPDEEFGVVTHEGGYTKFGKRFGRYSTDDLIAFID
jgi:hypothetical protein